MESLDGGPVRASAGDAAVSAPLVARWKVAIERDQALIEAARRRRETLLSLHREVREKALALSRLQVAGPGAQGLLADLDALGEAIQGTAEGPYFLSGM